MTAIIKICKFTVLSCLELFVYDQQVILRVDPLCDLQPSFLLLFSFHGLS